MRKMKKMIALLLAFTMILQTGNLNFIFASELILGNITEEINPEDTEEVSSGGGEEDYTGSEENTGEDGETTTAEEGEGQPEEPTENEDSQLEEGSTIEEPKIEETKPEEPSKEIVDREKFTEYKDFVLDTAGLSDEAISITSKGNYNDLSEEEKDVILVELSVREDTMSTLSDNGYSITESIPKAIIMQSLEIGLNDTLTMIENHGSEGVAYDEAILLLDQRRKNSVFIEQDKIDLAKLLVSGKTSSKAIDIYSISKVLGVDISEMILTNENVSIDTVEIEKINEEIRKEDEKNLEEALKEKQENEDKKANEIENKVPEKEEGETEDLKEEDTLEEQGETSGEKKNSDEIQEDTEEEKPLKEGLWSETVIVLPGLNTNNLNSTNLMNNSTILDSENGKNISNSDENSNNNEEKEPKETEEAKETEEQKETEKDVEGEQEDKDPIKEEEKEKPLSENLSEEKEKLEGEKKESEKSEKPLISENTVFQLKEKDIEKINAFSEKYSINPKVIIEYLVKNRLPADALDRGLEFFKEINNIKTKDDESKISPFSIIGDEKTRIPQSGTFNFKGSYNEIINMNTGALIFTDNIVSLKGKAGHDLNVQLVYDSGKTYTEGMTYLRAIINILRDNYDAGYPYKEQMETLINLTRQPLPRKRADVGYGRYVASGWSFNTVAVERETFLSPQFLSIPGVGTYQIIEESGGNYSLKDYKYNNIKVMKDTGTYFSSVWKVMHANGEIYYINENGDLTAHRDRFGNTITYRDTVKSNGQWILEITDSVGRKVNIDFKTDAITVTLPDNKAIVYKKEAPKSMGDYKNYYSHITEKKDQVGQITKFEYEVKAGQYDFYSVEQREKYMFSGEQFNDFIVYGATYSSNKPPGYQYQDYSGHYYEIFVSASTNWAGFIVGITDYSYREFRRNSLHMYDMDGGYTAMTNINHHNLVSVTYPTGEKTNYKYDKKLGKIGDSGVYEYYVVTERSDTGSGASNKANYRYDIDFDGNYSHYGYAGYSDTGRDGNLSSSYTYYAQETIENGETSTSMFNYKHQLVKRVTGNKTEEYKYTDKGQVEEAKTTITGNSTVTTYEKYVYDSYGNLTTYAPPIAEGNINTKYSVRYYYDTDRIFASSNPSYGLMTRKLYQQDDNTTITLNYTLTADRKAVAEEANTSNGTYYKLQLYTYNSFGNPTKILTDTGDFSVGLISTAIAYDSYQRPISSKIDGIGEVSTYDIMDREVTKTDKNGNKYTNTLDALGRITKVTNPDGSTIEFAYNNASKNVVVTDELGNRIRYTYNVYGMITNIYDLTSNKYISRNAYNNNMLIEKEVDANGVTTAYTYDEKFRIKSKSVNNQYTENYTYVDAYSSKEHQIIMTVPGSNGVPEMKTAQYVDKYGRKTIESGFLNGSEVKTTYEYDFLGNVTSFLNPEDRRLGRAYTSKYELNALGKPLKITDALGNTVKTSYDLLGRNLTVTDPKGNVSTFKYNNLSYLISEKLPFAGNEHSTKNYTYDNNGNMLRSSTARYGSGYAPQDIEVKYKYDKLNRLEETEIGSVTTRHKYDKIGNQIQLITGNGSQITAYEYDHLQRVTKITDPEGRSERYSYDLNGNLTKKVDKNGNTIISAYDKLNRLTGTTIEGMGGKAKEYLKYTYSNNGFILTEENENLTSTYSYDSLGRITEQKDSNGIIKKYTYDLNNSRKSFQLLINNQIKTNLQYEYDVLNRLSKVSENNKLKARYEYDQNGNRSYMETGTGVKTTYSYNNANLITRIDNDSTSWTGYSTIYTYYTDGNQATKTDYRGSTEYEYDEVGRLIKETKEHIRNQPSYEYEYDSSSNRIGMVKRQRDEVEKTTYEYDKSNRLLRELMRNEGSGKQSNSTYSYDGNGNQLTKSSSSITVSDITTNPELRIYVLNQEGQQNNDFTRFNEEINGILSEYDPSKEESVNMSVLGPNGNPMAGNYDTEVNKYDGFNRLIKTTKGSTVAEYAYKGDGLRLSKNVNGNLTTHVWDGSNIVADLDIDGEVKDRYIRGINLIESDLNGTYVYNAHGDVVQLVNGNREATKEYWYDAFGVEEDIDEGDANPFRYCGEYYDKETGNIYLRARYYTPSTGRFMSEDPIRDGLNFYTYAGNNPIMFVDPSGLVEEFINLRQTMDDYSLWEGIQTQLLWDNSTKTATAYMWRETGGYIAYGLFTAGVNGSYIEDGTLFVKKSTFRDIFVTSVIEPPLNVYDKPEDIINMATGIAFSVKGFGYLKNLFSKSKAESYSGKRSSDKDFQNRKGNSLDGHFGKHKDDFAYNSADEYLEGARKFLDKKPNSTTQSFTTPEGSYFRYDTKTNEFGIINEYGGISTYFKPKTGLAYWLDQIMQYAPK